MNYFNVRPVAMTRRPGARRGAITALVAIALPAMVLLVAFAINIAYIQMIREELRITCDSAAKAALVNYGSNQSQSTAQAFAQTIANQNPVAGQAVTIPASNIVFGTATMNSSGVYTFSSGGTTLNAVQVTGSVTPNYFLAKLLPAGTFTTTQVSTTARASYDIVLVLDRSASMAFDLSANEFVYPNVAPYNTQALIQNYFTAPSSTLSRWAALTAAVQDFVTVLEARNLDVHLSLVTYSETFSLGNYSAVEATTDVPLPTTATTITAACTSIVNAMNAYGSNPLLGDTNISAGLALAQAQLTGSAARTNANHLIILMTDGVPTTGNTNIGGITQGYCTTNNIITDVITFSLEASTGSYQTAMQTAATNSNGMYFNAPTAAQLSTAFTTIADSLPAVYIK
jgi:hypothetical protein